MMKKLYTIVCTLSLLAVLPALSMEQEKLNFSCDACTQQIDYTVQENHYLRNEHNLRDSQGKMIGKGKCSYLFCTKCLINMDITMNAYKSFHKGDSPLYDDCKTCYYFQMSNLKQKWQPITHPCDNCQQEKPILNRRTNRLLKTETKYNYQCLHILCKDCNEHIFEWQRPANDNVWWGCKYCSYFCHQHNKQCWLPKKDISEGIVNDASCIGANSFKEQYPNRMLPNITNETLFPRHPRDPENPDNTPSLSSGNNLKWLGLLGVGGVVCYAAYKAYIWYTGKDKQEDEQNTDADNDVQQENSQEHNQETA